MGKILLNKLLRQPDVHQMAMAKERYNALSEVAIDPVQPEHASSLFDPSSNMAIPRRQAEHQLGRQLSKSGKLSVAEPASISKFFVLLIMHLCKKVVLIDPGYMLAVHVSITCAVSVIFDLLPVPFPRSYFSRKSNFLNMFFASWAWGWTLVTVGPFILLTSYTYCIGNRPMVRRHLCRMLVGTVCWFVCTSMFDYIERLTGFCRTDGIDTKEACIEASGRAAWVAFDISGHTFLMIYNLLIIREEMKAINGWERFPDLITSEERSPTGRYTEDEIIQVKSIYHKLTPYIRSLVVILTLLSMIWEVVLLCTTLYFHTMPQKLIGAGFAALAWFLTYQTWFKMEEVWTPGSPGKGTIKYMKDKGT